VPHIRTPNRLTGSDVGVRRAAPRLGEHTDANLGGLGYSAADLASLRRERVI
jgi:crotonobetainyl-CoA:carnitine CoA-transferase CaiB-like acyl-CoA transferase